MKLSPLLYHCESCQELFERAPLGVCPVCASTKVYPLTAKLQPIAEQLRWLQQIRSGRGHTVPPPTEKEKRPEARQHSPAENICAFYTEFRTP